MKLTKDRLKQIVKEELEEVYRDPYSYGREYSTNKTPHPDQYAGLERERPVPVKIKVSSDLVSIGKKINQVISTIPSKEESIANLQNLWQQKEPKKFSGLQYSFVNFLSQPEKYIKDIVNPYDYKIEPNFQHLLQSLLDIGALDDIEVTKIKDKIRSLSPETKLQENMKLTRDKLKQIIKEELEEMVNQPEIGKVRVGLLKQRLKKVAKTHPELKDEISNLQKIINNTPTNLEDIKDIEKSKDSIGREIGKIFGVTLTHELMRELGFAPHEHFSPFNYKP